jgi:hypothetical protein
MSVPVHRRPYDAFLSHAHVDRAFVDALYDWLGNGAGLDIWYDARNMAGGDPIGSGLQHGIKQCRGLLLVASPDAIGRGWVKRELNVAEVERGDSSDFRIVALRLGGADVASVVKGLSWIDVPDAQLTPGVAAQILRAFYPAEHRPDPRRSRDVYVSSSWGASDNASAVAVGRALAGGGFRLIGDAKDQKGFGADRIRSIIESCGAFVGVIPFRGGVESASAKDPPYKYFLSELDLAARAGLPTVVVADGRIRRADGDDAGWLRMDTQAAECSPDVQAALGDLWDRWASPPHPHTIFFAVDLASASSHRDSDFRRLVEQITGMATVVGNEIYESELPSAIMRAIANAFLVIADISGSTADTFNLDVCIEAGMALAAGRNLVLTAQGRPRSTPFMLRHGGQLTTYADEVGQLAAIHKVARPYRRRVLNADLAR